MSSRYRPMHDAIDRRDWFSYMHNSIVKGWNVRYRTLAQVAQEEAAQRAQQEHSTAKESEQMEGSGSDDGPSDDHLARAQEIYERLMAEEEADAQAVRQEWEDKFRKDHLLPDEDDIPGGDFNYATGSRSGLYGKGDVSEETKIAAASILEEKSSQRLIEEMIQESGVSEGA